MMKKLVFGVAMAFVLVALPVTPASAGSVLLFDRGLPTANLNNAAGADRSNVQWAFTQDPTTPNDIWLVGDDFTLAGSGPYLVSTIRLWSTDNTGLSLWFGPAGGTITELAGSPTATEVTYADGEEYQGSSGNFSKIYQLDFSLGQVLDAGTTYQFFLDGPLVDYPSGTTPYTALLEAYVHSSNAALSGSTQQGADNRMLYAEVLNGALTGVGPWDSNGYGWDKSSDGNVQVYGTPVPEPGTLTLLGIGLTGLARAARRRRG